MKVTDPADSHLEDRAIELRVLKSAVVVFAVTLTAVFYRWEAVFAAFLVGYVVYRSRYYRKRIGVYVDGTPAVRDSRLELGLGAFALAVVAVALAIETVFSESWELGGVLSLPPIDFTDPDALINDLAVPLAWLVVLVPVVVISYVAMQFRKRLLVGLDSSGAAVRATLWDVLVYAPVYLLWIAVLTVEPLYELWEPLPLLVADVVGLTLETTDAFALIFGEAFTPVTTASLFTPIIVVAAYLGVQRVKYGDGTVPELFGYRGLVPPSTATHNVNVAVPVGLYLVFVVVAVTGVGLAPLGSGALLAAVAVSILVGANVFATTLTAVGRLSRKLAASVDSVVIGLVAGSLVLVLSTLVTAPGTPALALVATYLVVAAPLTFAGNWVAGRQAINEIQTFTEQIEDDPDAFEQKMADRLFVYTTVRDPALRTAGLAGLSSAVRRSTYRKDDALEAFVDALASDDDRLVQSGLQGLAVVLSYDRSKETYEQLVGTGAHEASLEHLETGTEQTRLHASEVVARLFGLELRRTGVPAAEHTDGDRLADLSEIAASNGQNEALVSAIVEYFATLWYLYDPGAEEPALEDADAQLLLGQLLQRTADASADARLQVVFAVTGDRAVADERRFALALETLESDHAERRYLGASVIRSSMDRHADALEPAQLLGLLDDPSPAVRWMGAEAILAFVTFAPQRGATMRDQLVTHLEANDGPPGRTEGAVIRALDSMDTEALIAHPSVAATTASYVDVRTAEISKPAAALLSALVDASRSISQQQPVRAAAASGLEHPNGAVRLRCLEIVITIIKDSLEDGRTFVPGLGANLASESEHSVIAAVSLAQILEAYPEDGLEILPGLAAGLTNLTPVDRQAVPFLVRGSTVSAVTVEMVGDVVRLEPGRCESLIEPLIGLTGAAERATLAGVLEILVLLSEEFPTEAKATVEAAAIGIEGESVGMRRDACRLLANVGAYHPEMVEPFVDRLVIATDDDSPRVRAPALVALTNVCAALPGVIESDIHRIVGSLDDDSAIVRTQAARLVTTIAEREPDIVEPAAETADRLRRLQRDPAIDVDAAKLQDASTAIQTGIPADEVDTDAQDREEIWSPETSGEMGASGDTNVFEPVGDDFDVDFGDFDDIDAEFDDVEQPDADSEPDESEAEHGSATQPDEGDSDDEIDEQATVIQPGDESEEDDEIDEQATVIQSDGEPKENEDVGDHATVIQPNDEPQEEDVGDHATVIQSDDEPEEDDVGDHATVIKPNDERQADDVGDHATVIQPNDERQEEDVGDHATVIQSDGEPQEDDVGDHATVIQSDDEPEEDDVEDHTTVIQPNEDTAETTRGDSDDSV